MVLDCQLAVATLALRGHNIERAFFTMGFGGVGQSLKSALLANFFGDMHAFVDLNSFVTHEPI